MFSSKADLNAFLHKEVKFQATISKVDFKKAEEAYIFWAKKLHSAAFDE